MPGLTDAEIAKLESAQSEGLTDDEINRLEQASYVEPKVLQGPPTKGAVDTETTRQVQAMDEEPPKLRALRRGVASGLTSGIVQPDREDIKAAPGLAMTGELAGGVAQALMLPEKRAFDALSGGVQGFNAFEGTIPQKIVSGVVGAGIGFGLGGAGKLAGGTLKAVREIPEKAAQKAIGLQSSDLFRIAQKGKKMVGETTKDVVNTLRDAGIFSKGAAPEAIERSLHEIRDVTSQKLDNIFLSLDASGHQIPTVELSSQIDDRLKQLKEFPEAFSDKIKKLEAFQRDLELAPAVSASKLRTMTQIVAEETFDKSGQIIDKEAFKVWQSLKDATDNLASKVGGQLGEELAQANKIYHASQQALPAVARKVAKEETTSFFTNPLKKAGQTAEGLAVKYVVGSPQWLQNNVKRLGKFAPVLQQAISRGGQSAAVNFFRLSQSNPEFREKLRELEEEDRNGAK